MCSFSLLVVPPVNPFLPICGYGWIGSSSIPFRSPPKQATRSSARHSTPHNVPLSASRSIVIPPQDVGNDPTGSTRASRQTSPLNGIPGSMTTTEPPAARRSTRKVKLTVSEPVLNPSSGPSSSQTLDAPHALLSADPQTDLPISDERATSVLNQNKPLAGTDNLSTIRYKGKNKLSEGTGTPQEGGSDASPAQLSDVCSSCVTTIYSHPSMSNLPVSASDREGGGAMLYCDSCPRSFHLLCLNPPIDSQSTNNTVPEGGWYCQECLAEHDFYSTGRMPSPPAQSGTELFGKLLARLQRTNPQEFQLPEDIRHYYKYVVTGPRGGYIDGRKWKLAKGNKQLLFEDRDLFKTRDRNNRPILCFKCGGSAVRSAVSGDAQMALLVPSSPTDEADEASKASMSQYAPEPMETPNLDLLSEAATQLISDPLELKTEESAATLHVNGTQSSTESVMGADSKGKVTGKRKREPSPIGQPPDNNSQTGPRTRRRTEHGPSTAKSAIFDLSEGGRPILSCDYCPLHWHMDCLDPPMTAIPARERRWMCPNHIEHIFALKPRIPRHSPLPTVEISKTGQYNSGLINILSQDPPPPPAPLRKKKPTVRIGKIEDMWVSSKKYRVPEGVVILDFWRKIRDPDAPMARASETASSMDVDDRSDEGSSTLTELSSEDEDGKKSGRSEHETKGVVKSSRVFKGSKGEAKSNKNKQRSKASTSTRPSRNLPKRGGALRKSNTLNDKSSSSQALDESTVKVLDPLHSPSKPATLNSKGGLTLRIPKPTGSPNGAHKAPSGNHSKPVSVNERPDGQPSYRPIFPRNSPSQGDSGSSVPNSKGKGSPRPPRTKIAASSTRPGLRSARRQVDPETHNWDEELLPALTAPADDEETMQQTTSRMDEWGDVDAKAGSEDDPLAPSKDFRLLEDMLMYL
ncbi:hypothetical protein CPB86DRAFT_702734 [Serendipita vermifera]|nr:hypothetical protein CPB86DRAFT_702734 [Serendipita vermifera]